MLRKTPAESDGFVKEIYFVVKLSVFKAVLPPKDLQQWTKYLEENKKIYQNCKGTENFDNCFCVIFECYYKSLILEKKTGTRLHLHPILIFS